MVGLCGIVGNGSSLPSTFVEAIEWRDGESTVSYADDRLELHGSFHPLLTDEQPVVTDRDDVAIWVWGDVYGYQSDAEYVPRTNGPDGSANFCRQRFEERGMAFVSGLNGSFALLVHDREAGTLSFVTDRLATRPLFYTRLPDGAILFTSTLQSLASHPAVDVQFDESYLYEYFQLRRVHGVKTPLSGVEEFQPGSVTAVDLDDCSMGTTSYWQPTYDPVERPFETVLDEFVETFQDVLCEWTHDDLDYGLLLSGGSDSRLVQAAIDQPLTTFHNTDWMSREAKIARRAAETNSDAFRLLKRDSEYDARLLERTPEFTNFSGWFDQAYFTGFEDDITDEVDVLISGLYADTLFDGYTFDTFTLDLSPIGNVTIPVNCQVRTIDDYVTMQTKKATEPLPYFTNPPELATVLRENIRRTNDGFECHGVRYSSLRDLMLYATYYPLGADTDGIFTRSLMQMCPYRTPFLDNRLLDLQQTIPVRYLLRRNIVNAGVTRLQPKLAEIPHARTGIPLKHPFAIDYLGSNVHGFWRKHIAEETPPEPYLDHGPWPNRADLIRVQSFADRAIRHAEDIHGELPFLDYDGARRCYDDHQNGADNTTALYTLLTFLNTPLAEAALDGEQAASSEHSSTGEDTHPPDAIVDSDYPNEDYP